MKTAERKTLFQKNDSKLLSIIEVITMIMMIIVIMTQLVIMLEFTIMKSIVNIKYYFLYAACNRAAALEPF